MARTPALYRTRITHLRRAPVHHYFEHRGHSWYVDVDELPELPRWLRPFVRFDDSLRERVDAALARHGIDPPGGTITALIQARVLGYGFSPLRLYWCHDAAGVLRHVIAEVHNLSGSSHAYVLPPHRDVPAMVRKKHYASPFNGVDGYYLVRAPRPDAELDVWISLHRDNQPAFVATMRGRRRRVDIGELIRLHSVAPLAALEMRVQAFTLRLRGVAVVPPPHPSETTSSTMEFTSTAPRSRIP
ncbi:MAG TPA: DUF1365 family protein [Mycobacterium sp.]|nr:DUF1365 family protein [Mycobacterium sp.]